MEKSRLVVGNTGSPAARERVEDGAPRRSLRLDMIRTNLRRRGRKTLIARIQQARPQLSKRLSLSSLGK